MNILNYGDAKVPKQLYLATFIYISYCLFFTPNFFLSVPIAIFPAFAYKLFWLNRNPNVVFWGMIMQWLSSATQLLYCNFLLITLDEKMKNSPFSGYSFETATLYSTLGLFAFSLGLYFAIRKIKVRDIQIDIEKYSAKSILNVYILVSIVIYVTSAVIWKFKSVVQIFYFLFYIKWGFFLIAFYAVNKAKDLPRIIFYSFLLLEIFLSFSSFFAGGFLAIITFSFIGLLALQPKLNLRSYFLIILAVAGIVHYLILWSAIKNEYRTYISNGELGQSSKIDASSARTKFFELMGNVNAEKYQDGIEKLVDRLGYIQFFAAAIDYVPKTVPFQNGDIYISALKFTLVPRFINSKKEELDDSKHTSQFTGIEVSGKESATSFSLGYIADAYIDMGPIFMYLLLAAMGALFGFCFYFIQNRSPNEVWRWIFTGPFFLILNINGGDTKKDIGALLIYFITISLLQKQIMSFLEKRLQ